MAQDLDDRLATLLRSVWWLPVLRGLLMIVLGLLLLVEPLGTLVALVWVFGIFAVVDGAVVLLQALLARKRPGFGWLVTEGLVSIAFGALIMLWPGVTALVLFYLLALWVLVLGVVAVIVAVTQYRARDLAWSGTLVFGLVGFLFGLLLAIKPQGTVDVILTVYGLFAFVAGVVMLVSGFATRTLARQLAAAARPAERAGTSSGAGTGSRPGTGPTSGPTSGSATGPATGPGASGKPAAGGPAGPSGPAPTR